MPDAAATAGARGNAAEYQPTRAPALLVVIPCLNEEHTVARVVRGIPQKISGFGPIQVLVIDDGSTDQTADRAREAGAEVVSHVTNRGLGATFQEAVCIGIARGVDVMVHIDGDGQFDPQEIPSLVKPLIDGQAHMATASRFLAAELLPSMPAVKRWGNRGVAFVVRFLTGRRFRDVSCGFRAFSREALLRMNLFGQFTYTQEVFLELLFKGLVIVEVPATVRGTREFGTSRIASSIPRYAFHSMRIMLRAFVAHRPFVFFSAIAALCFLFGGSLLGFLGAHYLRFGLFTPHIWAGFVGGSFLFLGVSVLVTGFLGDMLVRVLRNQEDIIYYQRIASRNGPHVPDPSRSSADGVGEAASADRSLPRQV